ncbi:MAG: hypothetical protein K2P40_09810 [Lachnospiraceae bacterium]|nr:hypothetical protein [Lachnospiraceae bacterium]
MRSATSAMALSSCCISCARLSCWLPWAIRSTDWCLIDVPCNTVEPVGVL